MTDRISRLGPGRMRETQARGRDPRALRHQRRREQCHVRLLATGPLRAFIYRICVRRALLYLTRVDVTTHTLLQKRTQELNSRRTHAASVAHTNNLRRLEQSAESRCTVYLDIWRRCILYWYRRLWSRLARSHTESPRAQQQRSRAVPHGDSRENTLHYRLTRYGCKAVPRGIGTAETLTRCPTPSVHSPDT